MSIKAVIFDLDGTLYDNSKIAKSIIIRSLLNLRILSSERKCRHKMAGNFYGSDGQTYPELFKRMSEMAGCTPAKAEKWFWDTYMPLQVKVLKQTCHRKPWVDATLSELKASGIKVACFSDYGMVKEKLEALGIDCGQFDFIADAPSLGGLKPCKEGFLAVAKELGVSPEDALVVGDREDTDGVGAKLSGMQFILADRHDTEKLVLKPE